MRSHFHQKIQPLLVLAVVCLTVACSSTRHADIERASEYNYSEYELEEGHPEVRMSAMGYLNEVGEGVINIAGDIVRRSLILREKDGENVADIEIVITIVASGGDSYSDSYTTTRTVGSGHDGFNTSSDLLQYEKNMKVPPGHYTVFFTVTDKASGKQTVREVKTFIPEPGDDKINLTSVQLQGKNEDRAEKGYMPVTTYDVSMNKDSLRFVIQVTNNESKNSLLVRSRLIRFEADTTAARPVNHPNYSTSSLPYKGIDYNSQEELEQTERRLDQPESVMIEFPHKRPERGSYRFEVTVRSNGEGHGDGEEEELYKARDFSVKGDNFPHLKSPRELAEPLIYLMGRDEHQELMAIEDPDSLKEAVDRFWLSNIGSINEAKNVISLFYERVEEANKKFTNFKEGWKTDRGMVYILFGPPQYVETRLNSEHWRSSRHSRDSRYNFLFERPRSRSDYYPFDNYLLQRYQNYFNYHYQQVQLWKSGRILYANL